MIPVYNRCHLIQRTLDSIRNQDFGDYEIIVVDDGSEDGTADSLDDSGITVVRQQNSGPGSARNNGASHAKNHTSHGG